MANLWQDKFRHWLLNWFTFLESSNLKFPSTSSAYWLATTRVNRPFTCSLRFLKWFGLLRRKMKPWIKIAVAFPGFQSIVAVAFSKKLPAAGILLLERSRKLAGDRCELIGNHVIHHATHHAAHQATHQATHIMWEKFRELWNSAVEYSERRAADSIARAHGKQETKFSPKNLFSFCSFRFISIVYNSSV